MSYGSFHQPRNFLCSDWLEYVWAQLGPHRVRSEIFKKKLQVKIRVWIHQSQPLDLGLANLPINSIISSKSKLGFISRLRYMWNPRIMSGNMETRPEITTDKIYSARKSKYHIMRLFHFHRKIRIKWNLVVTAKWFKTMK